MLAGVMPIFRATALWSTLAACATLVPAAAAPPGPPPSPPAAPERTAWDRAMFDCDAGRRLSCDQLQGWLGDCAPELKPRAARKGCELGSALCCRQLALQEEKTDPAAAAEIRWMACRNASSVDFEGLDACADLIWPLKRPAASAQHQLEAATIYCKQGPIPDRSCEALLALREEAPVEELDPIVAHALCRGEAGPACDEKMARASEFVQATATLLGVRRPFEVGIVGAVDADRPGGRDVDG